MSSLTFKSPRPLIQTGKATIPLIFEWNSRENPNFPIYRFHDGAAIRNIVYSDAIHGVRRVARYVRSFAGEGLAPATVAILANIDSITYSIHNIGILRGGHASFPISSRNGPLAIVDMLRRTTCQHILVSADPNTSTLMSQVVKELPDLAIHPLLSYEELMSPPEPTTANDTSDLPSEYDTDSTALILHSSGSTNHPKPILWSHKGLVSSSTIAWFGQVDAAGDAFALHCIPMFHSFGASTVNTAMTNGWIIAVFPPTAPLAIPTPESAFQGAVLTESSYIMTVPTFIELWSTVPEKVEIMKKMKGLFFGGAPLNQQAGDKLATEGISLITLYGMTEIGAIATLIPKNRGMEWAYFDITTWLKSVQREVGEGKYEIIVLGAPDRPLTIVNTRIGDQDAYSTNDLVEPHPTKPGLWKVYGRRDDQIVLSNGEKTNPLPLENIINRNPHIRSSVMYGHGKFQNGVIVEPAPEHPVDPSNTQQLEEFRNKIWPSIELANQFAPQHSRIFKEMILVTSSAKPFVYTVKGFPRRGAAWKAYAEEIEAAYLDVERSSQGEIPEPVVWDTEDTRKFLRVVVEGILRKPIADDADFFQNSCDSLQATWIRNTLLRAMGRFSPPAARKLPMSIIFQAPSIAALTTAVLRIIHDPSSVETKASTAEDLVRLANQYSTELPARAAQLAARPAGAKDVVLVTGTTGGFGCDVLEHLLADEGVATVFAFNRKGTKARERQVARFRERGLQVGLLDSPKFRLVEADLDVPGFSISPELLNEIRGSVTHILHNAWRVDFNLALTSFEVDLKGIRNMIALALSSPFYDPPKFLFVSSIGVFRNSTLPPPIPEVPIEASTALGSGYSESKWVAEQALYNTAEKVGLPVTVVRLGQVSGDSTGHWNEKEWFPAVVKSAVFTRCLPAMDGEVSFIPSYPAARALVEMRTSTTCILHLVHPRLVALRTLVEPVAQELGVLLVPYAEWLTALEKTAGSAGAGAGSDLNLDLGSEVSVDALRANPALRLLDFFKTFASGERALEFTPLQTEEAVRASGELARLAPLGPEVGRRWVAAWRASGFLPAGASI